ncbi:MAG: hypothetical protein LBF32_04505 [Streptococcaceae bacterium]|jgi:hypothetical protein|nr:hypothetical protein [Streptococcaceae bacterium]
MLTNEIKLKATINTISQVTKLATTGDEAINIGLDFSFGSRECKIFATAYKDTAIKLSELKPGTELTIEGAFYVDNYKDKKNGNYVNAPKIRINNFKVTDSIDDNITKQAF